MDECKAVRNNAGLIDLTSFSKFEISGKDSENFLNRICANRVPQRDGGIALTHMLTNLGGIECEFTITRLTNNKFYMLSAAVAEIHDFDWISNCVLPNEKVEIENVTDNFGVLALSGPNSRKILTKLTKSSLNNESFGWMNAKQ